MNKKAQVWVGILFIILIVMVVGGGIIYMDYNTTKHSKPCLEEIARKECNNEGMDFDFINRIYKSFYCKKNPRTIELESFKFLEEELEWCLK